MLKNIFTKTFYEKRWSNFGWFISVVGFSIMIVALFPTFRDSLGEALQNTPEGLKSLLGDASSYQNINSYIDVLLLSRIVFLTLIMGVVLGTGLLSGEESDGRLQSLLAQPVSRTKIYWQKFFAMNIIIFLITSGMFFGSAIGAMMVGELDSLNLPRLVQATLMTALITSAFGTLAYSIGAITGKKGTAGIVAGFFAFASYMITTLAGTATVLKNVNYFSPFKYFNDPGIMGNGIDINHLGIFTLIIALLAFLGWIIFTRRDIYQK